MLAKQELRNYANNERVWVGRYKNSHNLLHWHYDCELLFVEYGSIQVFCSGNSYFLQQGDAFFIESGNMHFMHATEGTILRVFFFSHELTKQVSQYRLESPRLSQDYGIDKLYDTLYAVLSEKKRFYQQMAENLVVNLILRIYQNESLVNNTQTNTMAEDFKALLADIEEKYASYTFEGAVRFMRVSESYFSKLFHSLAGTTFSQYLNYVKVEHAIEMLQSDRNFTMTEIAIACGFSTIRNFNRVFKTLTGYTPKHLPASYQLGSKGVFSEACLFNPTLKETQLLSEPAR